MGVATMVRVLVLDHTKLGESDSIITMLAADGSQVRGIAKGVRKSGSRFGASLEPYTIADIQLYSKRALPMITDAKIITSNKECREDLDRSAAAAVVAFALVRISQENQEEPRIFDLSATALERIGTSELECVPLLLSAYLFKLLAMHGYRPMLGNCVHCGEPVSFLACHPERSEGQRSYPSSEGSTVDGLEIESINRSPEFRQVASFSFGGGGVVCDNCLGAVASSTVSPQVISWVDYLLRETFAGISALCANGEEGSVDAPGMLTSAAQREILQFTNVWAREHIGVRIKPLDFYLSL